MMVGYVHGPLLLTALHGFTPPGDTAEACARCAGLSVVGWVVLRGPRG
jgi:hypothetical protein